MRAVWVGWGLLAFAAPLGAQAAGAVAGRVRDAATGRGIAGVIVAVDGGRQGASTDTADHSLGADPAPGPGPDGRTATNGTLSS